VADLFLSPLLGELLVHLRLGGACLLPDLLLGDGDLFLGDGEDFLLGEGDLFLGDLLLGEGDLFLGDLLLGEGDLLRGGDDGGERFLVLVSCSGCPLAGPLT